MILHSMLYPGPVGQNFVVGASYFGLTVNLSKIKGMAMGLVLVVMMLLHCVWRAVR